MRKAAADDALSALTAFINDESIEESADHEAELLQILVPSKTVFRKALRTWVSNARHPVVSPVDEVCSILGRLGGQHRVVNTQSTRDVTIPAEHVWWRIHVHVRGGRTNGERIVPRTGRAS